MKLKLAATSVNLWFETPRMFTVDKSANTSASYRAWARAQDPTATITLQGSAELTSLRGGGTVEVSNLKLEDLNFDGNLKAKAVRVSKLTVTGKLTCASLDRGWRRTHG